MLLSIGLRWCGISPQLLDVFFTTETRGEGLLEDSSEVVGHEGVDEGVDGAVGVGEHVRHDLDDVDDVIGDEGLEAVKDHDELDDVQREPADGERGDDHGDGFGNAASRPCLTPDGASTTRVPLETLTRRHEEVADGDDHQGDGVEGEEDDECVELSVGVAREVFVAVVVAPLCGVGELVQAVDEEDRGADGAVQHPHHHQDPRRVRHSSEIRDR